jgi:putative serine protease PepD
MSENDINEQPSDPTQPTPGNQPAAGAASENQGWRPPADAAAAPQPSAWTGPPSAPEPAATAPANDAAPAAGSAPAADSEPAASAPSGPEPATVGLPAASYPTSAQPASPYAAPSGYAVGSAYPGAPGDGTANYPSAGYAPTSSYPATGTTEPRRRRGFAGIAALSVLGLVLAAGGGVAGAALMHHYDNNDTVTTGSNGVVVSNAPIVDRSSLASIAGAVSPSVVSITTQQAEGSGVILSTDGYILTNNHVAATATGQSVDITFSSGATAKATLVGTDPKTDLAVFKAENVSNLTAAKFGNSSSLQVGDTVLAIGSPLGLDGSVTAGIVSALNRTIDETADTSPQDPSDPFGQTPQQPSTSTAPTIAGAIQTDAAINPGNSGGALVNTNGEVVGINTAIATNGADGNIGVGFAIPSNRAKEVADDLIKGTKVSHPQLGVSVSTADNNGGALVADVTAGSAADTAGLKKGDVITAFNGTVVHTSDDLLDDIQAGTVGTSYKLSVLRGSQTITVQVTLQESK